MNKKVKVILDILIVIAGIALLISLVVLAVSFKYVNREVEDPAEQAMSVMEYEMKHKAYNEILGSYYSKRMDSLEAPAGMESLYQVAEYAHSSFMSRVYAKKGDEDMIRSNAAKMTELREQLGTYRYAADEVDDMIKNAP